MVDGSVGYGHVRMCVTLEQGLELGDWRTLTRSTQ
jgi:hypothetical protein